jgi:serine/threonine-protein kinase HipA
VAIVVERFDRIQGRTRIVRLHQEDLCQALGVHPRLKYESDGGPGAQLAVELLRNNSPRANEDIDTFVGALLMSYLIGATDAHAKNYALLHSDTDRIRLSPLYDVASILPYDRYDPRRAKLAMKVGGKYRLRDIGEAEWRKLAKGVRLDEGVVLDRLHAMKRDIVARYQSVRGDLRTQGLTHPILDKLGDELEGYVRSIG